MALCWTIVDNVLTTEMEMELPLKQLLMPLWTRKDDKECIMGTVTKCTRSGAMADEGRETNNSGFKKDIGLVQLETSPKMCKHVRRELKGNKDEQQGSIEQVR